MKSLLKNEVKLKKLKPEKVRGQIGFLDKVFKM